MIASIERLLEKTLDTTLGRWTSPVDPADYLSAWSARLGRRSVGVIEQVTPITASSVAIDILPHRGWAGHRAGQFVTVGVDVDGVRHHRCYSLTSSPDRADGRIEIAVQAVPGGVVSNHLVDHARPGDVVQLGPADGDFTLSAVLPRRLLFISGGSGITPLMSIMRTLAADPGEVDVVLLHHAPDPQHTMFGAELADMATSAPWLGVDVQHTQCDGRRLDSVDLEARCPDWRDRETFACGPESLLTMVTDHWGAHGALDRLHIERFAAAVRSEPETDGTTARVTFGASGRDALTSGDTTLLDLAESAGLSPAYGCRMGVCHTCTTPLLAGCARDLRDGRLSEAGTHVQLCVSAPAGDVTLDL
jgi:ferredoxin-NADP reductase